MNKAKRRNSVIFEAENLEIILKKRRFSFNSDDESSCCYNSIGTIRYEAGQYADAKRLFMKALRREGEYASSQPSCIQFLAGKEPLTSRFCETSLTAKCLSPHKTDPYIVEKEEYDEGMNLHTTTLHTSESLPAKFRCATILYNIGLTCVCSKNYEEAIKWFEPALEMISECNDHLNETGLINTVKIHHNLGRCHYRLGQNRDSIRHFKQALSHIDRLGLGRQDLAAAFNCIAVIHFHTPSEIMDASQLFQRSLSIYRQLPGNCAKEIGTVLNNIGRVHYVLMDFDKALKAYGEALKIRQQQLGHCSIDVAATMLNTAQTHHKIGALDEAMKLYQDFVDLMIDSVVGSNSCGVATAYKGMGRIWLERDEMENAHSSFHQALEAERALFGNFHTELASTINEIGTLCYKMKDFQRALNYFREGLAIEKASIKSNSRNIIVTLRNIAQIQSDDGDYNEAIKTYEEAKVLQVHIFGKVSLEVASTIVNIGLMHFLQNEFLLSLAYYQEALIVRREYYGSDEHRDIASLLNFIGLVLYKLRKYEHSKEAFSQSLTIWQKLGEVNRDVANVWYNMATVFMESDDEEHAIKFYLKSLSMEKKILGEDNLELCTTLQHLGHIYQRRGEFDEAIKCITKALDIKRKSKGEASISLIKLLNMIGNINLMKGNVGEMMKCFVEATRLNISCEEVGQEFHSLMIAGYNFYALSKLHPACAEAA